MDSPHVPPNPSCAREYLRLEKKFVFSPPYGQLLVVALVLRKRFINILTFLPVILEYVGTGGAF